jgi:thioredoxin-related protein
MLRALALSLCLLVPVLTPSHAKPPLELLFVERKGCPWCIRFEREITPIYAKTEVGGRAPLVKVDLDGGQPRNVSLESPVRFTPTFVLVRDGKEVGRITGYIDDATFWGLLEKMLAEHKDAAP